MPAQGDADGLSAIVDTLGDLGKREQAVSVDNIREAFGHRSFGPFLLIPALLEISPIGGIPGLPTLLSLIITLFALQILIGRKHLWLPGFIANRTFKGERLSKAMSKMKGVARWTDKILRPRVDFATHRPFVFLVAILTIGLCATVPFLEIVPFASTFPMGAIALFGLGITARDGLVVLVATALSIVAFVFTYYALA